MQGTISLKHGIVHWLSVIVWNSVSLTPRLVPSLSSLVVYNVYFLHIGAKNESRIVILLGLCQPFESTV